MSRTKTVVAEEAETTVTTNDAVGGPPAAPIESVVTTIGEGDNVTTITNFVGVQSGVAFAEVPGQ